MLRIEWRVLAIVVPVDFLDGTDEVLQFEILFLVMGTGKIFVKKPDDCELGAIMPPHLA